MQRRDVPMIVRNLLAWVRRGITLIELIAAAVILGVLALIVVPNVVNALGLSKATAFGTTIGEVQAASDRFYGITGAYPTYSGSTIANQPGACPDAFEIVVSAQDPNGQPFVGAYLRSAPSASAATAGLNLAAGSTVYYGVASGGFVFATQAGPEVNGDEWNLGGTPVYTQQDNAPDGYTTLQNLCSGVATQTNSPQLTANATLSGSTLTLSGDAPANSTVTVTQTDPGQTTVQASSSGTYSTSITLDATPNIVTVTDGPYAVELIVANGNVISPGSGGTSQTVDPAPPMGYGTGADGALVVSTSGITINGKPYSGTTLGGTWNFTSIDIQSGATLNVTPGQKLIMYATQGATIDGTINANGDGNGLAPASSNGGNGATMYGEVNGVCDYSGATYSSGGGGGGGALTAGSQGFSNVGCYGTVYPGGTGGAPSGSVTNPAAGGNGGSTNATYYTEQGGYGGGVVIIEAASINVNGTIEANGQNGGPNGYSGGGGGGSIVLEGQQGVSLGSSALLSAVGGKGGGTGGNGLVLLEGGSITNSGATINPSTYYIESPIGSAPVAK